MFAQVTRLQYWKSEHDEATCEDACEYDSLRGLFALSDGAGTTLFSNIWAQILVDQFVTLPLLSNDPFETEWWVRRVQETYKARVSSFGMMSWNVLQKAQNEGSHATLATLRIVKSHTTFARAELLVIGDSCIFIENARTGHILSFPLTQDGDFDRAPICFPSKLSLFNRYFHRCQVQYVDLESGDRIVLATDAVARWIINAGDGRYATTEDALHEVMTQTSLTWEQFILGCRKRKEMVDDDTTALIVSFCENTQQQGSYLLLGTTTEHAHMDRKQRKEAFEQAIHMQNKELIAIYYGDGKDLALEGISLSSGQVQQARQVADALREVLSVLRDALNSPNVVARIGPVWRKYASMLATEACAEHLRQTLVRLGVPLLPSSETQPPLSSLPPSSDPVTPMEADDNVAQSQLPVEGVAVQAQEALQEIADASGPIRVSEFEFSREREKLALEKQFLHALRTEDDELILVTHRAILHSPYAREIVFSFQDEQRIALAEQRSNMKQFVQEAIAQGDVQHMTHAYHMAQKAAVSLSEDELNRLELACRVSDACKSGDDDQLIATFEDILHSPYHGFFVFSPQEEDLVAQAWQRKMQQATPFLSERGANAPTISDAWFRKICHIKELYLQHSRRNPLSPEQLEESVIEDLANDQYIQEAIEEINRKLLRKKLDPEYLINTEFNAFRSSHSFDYNAICNAYQLSDDEVKAALRLFLRAQVFAQYLQKRQMQLQDWLNIRRHEGKTSYSRLTGAQEEKRSKLLWWRR